MNKTLEYYMSLHYKLEIIEDDDGFAASFPELPGCITGGDTLLDVISNAEDAKKCWLMSCIEDGIKIPEPENKKYSGQFKLRVPKTLHRQLALKAKEEGVSMNAYCNSILSKYC